MNAAAPPAAEAIDALLPQTQCGRCGYAGCAPYAAALAGGSAEINQCPPGGAALIAQLAALLGRPVLPLNPDHGHEAPPLVACIDEQACIGCARCLPPCPVDAIIGAQREMHSVIADWCTGCELCLPACPVDCITLHPRPREAGEQPLPALNRSRFAAHRLRAERRAEARAADLATQKRALRTGKGT